MVDVLRPVSQPTKGPRLRRQRWVHARWSAVLLFVAASVGLAHAALPPVVPLPALGADATQTSVSGLSSGAFMAVQLQVAYSKTVVGAGIIAGGPYYCAANNVAAWGLTCMGQIAFAPPNPHLLLAAAKGFASKGQIDGLSHLTGRKVYVYSGTDDTIVRQPAVDATVGFFQLAGLPAANVKYVNDMPSGHAVITPNYGNTCSVNQAPYISHCSVGGQGYDQAGALLQHIYGAMNARVSSPAGQVLAFDQRPYAKSLPGALADTGYLYVPPACGASGAHCKVHVAIHGCGQSAQSVGNQFYTDTGYNEWADNNKLLVLYPQVDKSYLQPFNPSGCWDWWGYTGSSYALKSGVQMKAIMGMVGQLTQSAPAH
jgi:hypothetical protein